jgi:hypothetical protein
LLSWRGRRGGWESCERGRIFDFEDFDLGAGAGGIGEGERPSAANNHPGSSCSMGIGSEIIAFDTLFVYLTTAAGTWIGGGEGNTHDSSVDQLACLCDVFASVDEGEGGVGGGRREEEEEPAADGVADTNLMVGIERGGEGEGEGVVGVVVVSVSFESVE